MADYGLKDRVALITGANNPRGIGAATAFAFVREGAKVVLVYKRIPRPFDRNKTDRNGADRYFPGFALLALGTAAKAAYGPSDFIRAHLKKLVEQFQETCYYGIPQGSDVLYLEKIDSPQPLRMLTEIGRRLPAYATGLGKALLMDLTPEQLNALYPKGMKPLTENTITDPDVLYAQLQEAKQLGYTWETEESTAHIRCFAVPVRQGEKIIGAVSIAIPIFRYRETEKSAIVNALKETAKAMEFMN